MTIKRLAGGFGALIVLAGVLLAGAFLAGRATLPPRHQHAVIAGLGAPVAVTFDHDGVPWIRAASETDAAAALGFVHARDRMFQMDLMRRVGAGRVSEIAGASTLKLDETMRTLGLRRSAEADWRLLPSHTRALLTAYSRGVNAWIALRGRFAAPEFVVLGAPAPWSPIDSLLWGKIMSLSLSGNYRTELTRLALSTRLTPDLIRQLWPAVPQPPAPQAAAASDPRVKLAALLNQMLPRFPAPFTLPATASNEWAVDGAHSATGAPLLAGDPHLSLGMPGIWYLARIDTPGAVLAGATAPGMPLLVIGHNAHVAWTFTSSGTDTQDVFIETPVDAGHYAGPDGPLPYTIDDEVIHVRGGADHALRVRRTRHGPVISDLDTVAAPGQVLAVEMAGLAPGDTAAAGLDALDQATTLDQAIAAAPAITSPNQNLLAADGQRIGLAMTGRVPIRRSGDGSAPVDGASGAYDWIGWAEGAQLPRVIAPASGRLVNGNERVAPADFPVFLGADGYGDWRSRRIRQLLDAHPRATVDDFVAMQTDVDSTYAAQLLPVLRLAQPATALGRRALGLLAHWNGVMDRRGPQALIFNAWLQRFAIETLRAGQVPNEDAGPRLEFVAAVLTGDEDSWCVDGCAAAVAAALDRAAADLAHLQGPFPSLWRWGRAHKAIFAHPVLGQLPVIGRFARRTIATSGDDSTVGRAGMAQEDVLDFADVHAASYRGVYDLSDLDRSRFVVAPGQSGNLFSRHVDDFIRRWRNGGTIMLGPRPPDSEATLALSPAAPK